MFPREVFQGFLGLFRGKSFLFLKSRPATPLSSVPANVRLHSFGVDPVRATGSSRGRFRKLELHRKGLREEVYHLARAEPGVHELPAVFNSLPLSRSGRVVKHHQVPSPVDGILAEPIHPGTPLGLVQLALGPCEFPY